MTRCNLYRWFIHSQTGMEELGRRLAMSVRRGETFCVHGDLGTGKTCIARGFVRHCTKDTSLRVTSPTYLLNNVYPSLQHKCNIHHLDLYRLSGEDDLTGLGLEQALQNDICIIEWPDRLGTKIPNEYIHVEILHAKEHGDSGDGHYTKVDLKSNSKNANPKNNHTTTSHTTNIENDFKHCKHRKGIKYQNNRKKKVFDYEQLMNGLREIRIIPIKNGHFDASSHWCSTLDQMRNIEYT
eukprot:GSMAST32.ASY1.ANO1.1393.1 assembled CDS